MSQDWKTQKERGSPILMRLITWFAMHIGRKPARLALHPICVYFILFTPKARRSSRQYLSTVLARKPKLTEIYRHFYFFASMMLDRVFMLSKRIELFSFEVHNAEQFKGILDKQQGCILMGSHLGSFEMMRAMATVGIKVPLKVLMYRDNAEKSNEIFTALNPEMANCIIPIGGFESMINVKASIDQGDAIGILADRLHASDKAVNCRFFDKLASFPAGPMLMAAALKVPVVLCFGLYLGGNRYAIYTEVLAERIDIPRENRQQELLYWVQRYVDRLEYYCKLAPYNWFNFYDFWKTHA